jgi:uncharacterized membrane protein
MLLTKDDSAWRSPVDGGVFVLTVVVVFVSTVVEVVLVIGLAEERVEVIMEVTAVVVQINWTQLDQKLDLCRP